MQPFLQRAESVDFVQVLVPCLLELGVLPGLSGLAMWVSTCLSFFGSQQSDFSGFPAPKEREADWYVRVVSGERAVYLEAVSVLVDWYQWNFPLVSQLQNEFLLILRCSDWRHPEGRGRWEWLLVPVTLQSPMLQAHLCLAGECGCLDLSCGCMPVTIVKWGTELESYRN